MSSNTKVKIPPIKCQGIKSKLVPWIKSLIDWRNQYRWVEPFVGSGVVGFNMHPKSALFCDSNPHIINFYSEINKGIITPPIAREFLETEGQELAKYGIEYYYSVRERFNNDHDPLDFLFLNRSCFNGVIRFNSKGGFNVPFGHKPHRFSKAYITKIVNQIDVVFQLSRICDWSFRCKEFQETLSEVTENDFVYCDPPYVGRHVDYYNGWDGEDEMKLFKLLKELPTKFVLSTWHSNQHRVNSYLKTIWSEFEVLTREHFYHVGANEKNRKPMLEALVLNFEPDRLPPESKLRKHTTCVEQLSISP